MVNFDILLCMFVVTMAFTKQYNEHLNFSS
jgi:hypothetical protein